MKFNRFAGLLAATLVLPISASAVTIDVLWTSGTATYNSAITTLAASAPGFDPASNGSLNWNVTLWDGTTDPGFSSFDVLVVGSTCSTGAAATSSGNCGGSNGFFSLGVDAAGVLKYKDKIAAARGSRTFLSGQDADWHYLNRPGPVDNGPKGFLINAVNWAASGTGLGIVSMTDRYRNNSGWWTNNNSFLKTELGTTPFWKQSNTVNIGAGQGSFPINEGLTSAGLSNWNTSSHACFDEVTGYARINFAPNGAAPCGVTIVTKGEEGGDTGGGDTPPVVPLPASAWLLIAGIAAMRFASRRRAA